jgi:hypothetical protein
MSSPIELLSPASGSLIFDDFNGNDSVADGAVGAFGWELVTIGNASTLALQTAQPNGVLRLTTAATADGDGEVLRGFTDGIVLKPSAFVFEARVRYPVELTSSNFRIGLDDSVTATRPTVGVTIESDAGVLTCRTDSADHGDESLAVTGISTLTSGTTMVVATWHTLRFVGSGRANAQGGPDAVTFYVDGQLVGELACNIDDDEEMEAKIVHWQDTGGADAVAWEIDYFSLWLPRV